MPHAIAVFCAADWRNKAMHCCEDMLGCLAVTPLYGQNHSIVRHLIMHKPSRPKEYVSDAGLKSPLTINHTPWKMPNENTQKLPPAPTGDSLWTPVNSVKSWEEI